VAIEYFDATSTPTDNGTYTTSPAVVTPPGSMTTGDLVIIVACAAGTSGTLAMSQAGGQSWNTLTARNATRNRTNVFWCRFNGTWTADPSVTMGSTSNNIVQMVVFRPTISANIWSLETNVSATYTAPTTPFTVTIPTANSPSNGNVVVAIWTSADDNTWGNLTAGWNNTDFYQVRNTSGTYDQSQTICYKVQESAGATGAVRQDQLTLGGDAGTRYLLVFKESLAATTIPTPVSGIATQPVPSSSVTANPTAVQSPRSGLFSVIAATVLATSLCVCSPVTSSFSPVEPSSNLVKIVSPSPTSGTWGQFEPSTLLGAGPSPAYNFLRLIIEEPTIDTSGHGVFPSPVSRGFEPINPAISASAGTNSVVVSPVIGNFPTCTTNVSTEQIVYMLASKTGSFQPGFNVITAGALASRVPVTGGFSLGQLNFVKNVTVSPNSPSGEFPVPDVSASMWWGVFIDNVSGSFVQPACSVVVSTISVTVTPNINWGDFPVPDVSYIVYDYSSVSLYMPCNFYPVQPIIPSPTVYVSQLVSGKFKLPGCITERGHTSEASPIEGALSLCTPTITARTPTVAPDYIGMKFSLQELARWITIVPTPCGGTFGAIGLTMATDIRAVSPITGIFSVVSPTLVLQKSPTIVVGPKTMRIYVRTPRARGGSGKKLWYKTRGVWVQIQ
jgi:hypothetical protein